MDVGIVFGQMLVLLAMMLIGYFCYRLDWITDDMSQRLSKLVVNVFNPVLVVNGVLGQSTENARDAIAVNLAVVAAYFLIQVLFSYVILVVLRPPKEAKSIYRLMTIFSNLAFMGIPVIKSIYGDAAMIYLAFYILGYNLMLYTYGTYLTRKARLEYTGQMEVQKTSAAETIRKIMNPGVVAALLAVFIFAAQLKLPQPCYTFCDYVGNATIPLSMMMIGVSVAQVDGLKQIFTDWRIYMFIVLRMVLLPIAAVLLNRLLQIDAVIYGVFVIELGMPVGSIINLLVKESGADGTYCTKGVVLSTLASIVTIPFICMFL